MKALENEYQLKSISVLQLLIFSVQCVLYQMYFTKFKK